MKSISLPNEIKTVIKKLAESYWMFKNNITVKRKITINNEEKEAEISINLKNTIIAIEIYPKITIVIDGEKVTITAEKVINWKYSVEAEEWVPVTVEDEEMEKWLEENIGNIVKEVIKTIIEEAAEEWAREMPEYNELRELVRTM